MVPPELEVMYLEARHRLRRLAIVRFGVPPDEAEALVHDVFIAWMTSAGEVRAPRRWLVAATSNASRNWLRKRSAEVRLQEPPVSVLPAPSLDPIIVAELLAICRPRAAALLRLVYQEGMGVAEAGRALGTSAGYADTLLRRTLKELRKKVGALPEAAGRLQRR